MDTEATINEPSAKIAALNDEFRKKGTYVITNGIVGVPNTFALFKAIEEYNNFNEDTDPYGEHDFGSLEWSGSRVFWNIDYYNQAYNGWCDPLSPNCRRVLTVMLAEEY